ncbi:MAG: hypothetical protein R3362_02360 [Rhodothermales bacterium]|nr:hypothetical protein [Rhodothermales bacterium]
MRRLPLVVALLLFAAPALGQPPEPAMQLAAAVEAPTSADVAGTYEADHTAFRISSTGRNLVIRPAGQPAIDVLSARPGDARLNIKAERLLKSAFAGDLDGLRAAAPPHRSEAASRDYGRYLQILTEEFGPVESIDVLGTTPPADDRAVTHVRVRFERGEETVRLVWREGRLALLARGQTPRIAAYPVPHRDGRFAVLEAGEPVALLTFDGSRVVVRNAAAVLHAERTR